MKICIFLLMMSTSYKKDLNFPESTACIGYDCMMWQKTEKHCGFCEIIGNNYLSEYKSKMLRDYEESEAIGLKTDSYF